MATIRYLNKYNTSQLLSINNTRLALRCYTLVDLLDGSGTELQRFVFQLRRRHIDSPYNWTRSEPCKQDYQIWKEAITTTLPFKQLGVWFYKQYFPPMCKYDISSDLVYVPHETHDPPVPHETT